MSKNTSDSPLTFKAGVSEEMLLGCMRCGFCLPTCPTYAITGNETDSPRGRLALVRYAQTGKLDATKGFDFHTYACLLCKACVTNCPAGVPVDDLIMEAREVLDQQRNQPAAKDFIFRRFMQDIAWMERAAMPMRLIQRLGLPALGRITGISKLLPKHLGDLEPLLPKLPWSPTRKSLHGVIPAKGERLYRVGYFLSCMDDIAYPRSAEAVISLLTGSGCEVVIPPKLSCCGMPHRAYGDPDAARMVARKNLAAFAKESVDAIVTDCGTCGSALAEYEALFSGHPESESAAEFADKVVDISDWLARIGWRPAKALESKITLTYHQSCHLGRGQGVVTQPRDLLRSVEGIEFVEMKEADWCCGGAGSYNQTNFECSMQILDRKMANAVATGAGYLATGCPSCQMQLGLGIVRAQLKMKVVHPIHLLARVCR